MSTLYCSNLPCSSANDLENTVCQVCGTPLVRRYLWAVGDWIKAYKLDELVEERYLLVKPRVFLDTKPAEKPQTPEDVPDSIKLYLRLFPARLHVPQLYGYLPSPDPEMDLDIWLLEYGPLPLDEKGELRYPELLPTLAELWPQTSPLQQLTWLWQIARLWQPLEASGVVSSLLDRFLLRVHGSNIQLLELKFDEHTYHGVKDLAEIWTDLFEHCHPSIKDFCTELLSRLGQGKIPHADYLAALLEKAIAAIAGHYEFGYQVVTATDKGPTRDHNEDYCYPLSTIRISFPEPDLPDSLTETPEAGEESQALAITDTTETSEAGEESEALAVTDTTAKDSEKIPSAVPPVADLTADLTSEENQVAVTEAVNFNSEANEILSPIPTEEVGLESGSTTLSAELDKISETMDFSQGAKNFVEESHLAEEPEEGDVPTTPSAEKMPLPLSGESEKSTSTLAIICDGVGGQDGGEVASQVTVNALSQMINSRLPVGQRGEAQQVLPQLHRCISDVNDRLNYRNDQEKRSERGRMGTTLVMLMSEKHQVYLGNVGDSRCYLITSDSCQQVTVDDDLASREVRLGYIFYREAIRIPRSGALVQAMGLSPSANLHPSLARLFISENALFLLCSDGLCDFDRVDQYWSSELLPVLQGKIDLGTGCDRLINLANAKNGHDNVTVSLISVEVKPPEKFPSLSYDQVAAQLPEVLPTPIAPVITAPVTNVKGSLLTSDLSDVGATLLEVFNQPIDFRTSNQKFWIGMAIGVLVWGSLVYLMGRLLSPPEPPEIVPEATTPNLTSPESPAIAPEATTPEPVPPSSPTDGIIPSPVAPSSPAPSSPPPLSPSP
ncbi:MAG: PP2C family protein-serine/threonine phosphatase [Microcystaceae cyanobacterium]